MGFRFLILSPVSFLETLNITSSAANGHFQIKDYSCKANRSKIKLLSLFLISLATNFTPQALDLLHSCSFYSKHSFLSLFIFLLHFIFLLSVKEPSLPTFSSTILLFSPCCLIFLPFEVKAHWKAFPVAKMISVGIALLFHVVVTC